MKSERQKLEYFGRVENFRRKGILLERARPYQEKRVAFYGLRAHLMITLARTQRVHHPMCMASSVHKVTHRETKATYDGLSNVAEALQQPMCMAQ